MNSQIKFKSNASATGWCDHKKKKFVKYFFWRKGKAYIIRTCLACFDPNTTELFPFPWHYICVPSWVYHIFQNCLSRPPRKIVDHSGLLAKLKTLGVGCTALEWFGSYFSGRQQYVRIGAEASSLGAISHGVPQGSILGPALFTIYINDLSNIPKIGSLESHVDDSKLYLSFFVKDTCGVVQQIS